MACKLCNDSGYVRKDDLILECSCRRKKQFRDFLVSRGFKLEHIKQWDTFSKEHRKLLGITTGHGQFPFFKGEKSILFMGSGTMDLFYSAMFSCLENDKSSRIVDSGTITSDMLESNPMPYSKIPYLGVILGFDLTNKVQEKSMGNFIFNRAVSTQTLYYFPNITARKLESVYGDVFTEMEKEGKLVKIAQRSS